MSKAGFNIMLGVALDKYNIQQEEIVVLNGWSYILYINIAITSITRI